MSDEFRISYRMKTQDEILESKILNNAKRAAAEKERIREEQGEYMFSLSIKLILIMISILIIVLCWNLGVFSYVGEIISDNINNKNVEVHETDHQNGFKNKSYSYIAGFKDPLIIFEDNNCTIGVSSLLKDNDGSEDIIRLSVKQQGSNKVEISTSFGCGYSTIYNKNDNKRFGDVDTIYIKRCDSELYPTKDLVLVAGNGDRLRLTNVGKLIDGLR